MGKRNLLVGGLLSFLLFLIYFGFIRKPTMVVRGRINGYLWVAYDPLLRRIDRSLVSSTGFTIKGSVPNPLLDACGLWLAWFDYNGQEIVVAIRERQLEKKLHPFMECADGSVIYELKVEAKPEKLGLVYPKIYTDLLCHEAVFSE